MDIRFMADAAARLEHDRRQGLVDALNACPAA